MTIVNTCYTTAAAGDSCNENRAMLAATITFHNYITQQEFPSKALFATVLF
jgi:hypothetical protein